MLTPRDAVRAILADIAPLPAVRLPIAESLDHVLAEDVTSPIDLPPWDNSAMDGYAVRSSDVTAGAELTVIESVPAGRFPTKPLGPGECTRIFTGAPLPVGADGVIRQEDATPRSPDRVRIDNARDAGRNVRYRGEDIRRHSVVLRRGTPLGPAQLGVLASMAYRAVTVHRRPLVAFLGSGDEIADLDEAEAILAGRKIASSNSYTLAASLARAGAAARNLGIARDDPDDLRARLTEATGADLVLTTAGVSVGEHDHVRRVFEQMGGTMTFWRIRMRPGAPVGFGRLGGVPWIGLPGNPVSTMVTFELFVRPVIRRMLGHTGLFRRTVRVTVAERITLGPPLRHFLRAIIGEQDGQLAARLTGPQGSGILTSMALANALLIVPEEKKQVEAGEELEAIMLDETVHVPEAPY
ncbi:MAG TPA: gephyrin-like molybdotransferase Glp [Gemmatimonadales bacterium]|nr:gephyrin-like molybdotransferase Glp [Gemmatimonadales bacterium]